MRQAPALLDFNRFGYVNDFMKRRYIYGRSLSGGRYWESLHHASSDHSSAYFCRDVRGNHCCRASDDTDPSAGRAECRGGTGPFRRADDDRGYRRDYDSAGRHRLYTTSEIMGCKPQETAREAVPFYIAMLTVILNIAFIPQVTMFLPNLVYR